jgi:CheY-like chemotaxis protein/signal transduction histidine kinase
MLRSLAALGGQAVSLFAELFAEYRAYHQHGPQMLHFAGILGTVAFPAFYFLKFVRTEPTYDDLWIRILGTLACALLLLRPYWPERLRPYYLPYSYGALVFALPFTFVFTSLMQGGGAIGVANTLMAVFFVILMTDWRNTLVMLSAGIGMAVVAYRILSPDPDFPAEYVMRAPVLLLVAVGGCLFKVASNDALARRLRHGYIALAGSLAHEMRNPLGQFRASLDSFKSALPPPTTARGRIELDADQVDALYRHLAQGEVAVRRGLQVISMTLDEVSARPIDVGLFVPLSAAAVAHKALQEYGFEVEEARSRVSVLVVDDFSFRGDETAFIFVLFNLLKNALFYAPTHPDLQVTIRIESSQVVVEDNGPGIRPEILTRLFEPFASVGKAAGTGLGLAYCRRVMRAFGGEIACVSEPGRSTRFLLTLPAVGLQEAGSWSQALLERAHVWLDRRRLLLVDDDAPLRAQMRRRLAMLGVRVEEAHDGASALARLAGERFDIVVLDVNMPSLDGYAVAQQIRHGATPLNRDVCIVAHTVEAPYVAGVKALKAGMDGFLSKPCDQITLVQSLMQVVEAAQQRQEMRSGLLVGRRVLLADDNPVSRKVVATYLAQAGMHVAEVEHGQAALDRMRSHGPWDAILMDVDMPGMSGLETTRAIRRETHPTREVPVIAVTAYSGQMLARQAREAGMDGFIEKPVDEKMLRDLLVQVIGERCPVEPCGHGLVQREDDLRPAEVLLDRPRLDNLHRIGLLDELLQDFMPAICVKVDKLLEAQAERDVVACLSLLHSLLGMSGEIGALALHRAIRQVYVPLREEQRWPDDDWVERIAFLCEQTERAAYLYVERAGLE